MAWQRIYILRHGETDWNRKELFRGRSDIELSQRGRDQARAAAEALRSKRISSMYTSPVLRSRETAETVSEVIGLPYTESPELSDPDCGTWVGKDLEDVRISHPQEFQLMENRPSQLQFPGGESVSEVYERVSRFILQYLWDHEDGDVLLVTHNFIFQVFSMAVLGCHLDNLYNLEMENGAISEYVSKGDRVIMVKVNDNHHLDGI
jgi:broad specificity phosphatase PhoE